jgi:hypothetical protein
MRSPTRARDASGSSVRGSAGRAKGGLAAAMRAVGRRRPGAVSLDTGSRPSLCHCDATCVRSATEIGIPASIRSTEWRCGRGWGCRGPRERRFRNSATFALCQRRVRTRAPAGRSQPGRPSQPTSRPPEVESAALKGEGGGRRCLSAGWDACAVERSANGTTMSLRLIWSR